MNAPLASTDITAGALVKLLRTKLPQSIAEAMAANGPLLHVRGRLGAVRLSDYGKSYIRLTDGDEELQLEVANTLLRQHDFAGGEYVAAIGVLKSEFSRRSQCKVDLRLDVSDFSRLDGTETNPTPALDGIATTAFMKALALRRTPFPVHLPIKLTVIHSKSGQAMVDQDFLHEIDKLADRIILERIPVNMLSSNEIATAIGRAHGDIVALIRGGGDENQFDVFDRIEVIKALDEKNAYRVIGLGHSANRTLLDLVADFAANTPTHAGTHIRECVEEGMVNVGLLRMRLAETERELERTRERVARETKLREPLQEKEVALAAELAQKRTVHANAGLRALATHLVAFLAGGVALVFVVKKFHYLWQ